MDTGLLVLPATLNADDFLEHPELSGLPRAQPELPWRCSKAMKAMAASGKEGLVQIVIETHAGMTTEELAQIVTNWLGSTSSFDRPYMSGSGSPNLLVACISIAHR
jgi:hypothetical protein